jgi:hypothetical protein
VRRDRLAANPAGAIYGTILATSVIAAAGNHGEPPGRIAAATAGTLLVFWLAHVYSEALGNRLASTRFTLAAARATMVDELPMVEAPLPSILFLVLGAVGLIGDRLAINLALANGVAQLFGWGALAGRRLGWSWLATAANGLVYAAFGVVIILLKALLH